MYSGLILISLLQGSVASLSCCVPAEQVRVANRVRVPKKAAEALSPEQRRRADQILSFNMAMETTPTACPR